MSQMLRMYLGYSEEALANWAHLCFNFCFCYKLFIPPRLLLQTYYPLQQSTLPWRPTGDPPPLWTPPGVIVSLTN